MEKGFCGIEGISFIKLALYLTISFLGPALDLRKEHEVRLWAARSACCVPETYFDIIFSMAYICLFESFLQFTL